MKEKVSPSASASLKARQRRYPRFQITKPEIFRGSIGPLRDQYRLISFSAGGAGFVAEPQAKLLAPPLRLPCTFCFPSFQSEGFSIEADLLYSFDEYKGSGYSGVFYGVEFCDKSQDIIARVIKRLEELAERGVVGFETKDVFD